MLKKWKDEEKVQRLGPGKYKFEPKVMSDDGRKRLFELLLKASDSETST